MNEGVHQMISGDCKGICDGSELRAAGMQWPETAHAPRSSQHDLQRGPL